MFSVYWIEDEPERLTATFDMLEDELGRGRIQTIRDAAAARRVIDRIREHRAPILLDLYIPSGDPALPLKDQRGPKVGLRLLKEFRVKLGNLWPIFIVSGNISFEIKEELTVECAIPQGWIFTKPLNARNELLVKSVAEVVLASAPGGSLPPV